MKFYRPLNQISALTFDLDNTLYNNDPIILRAEQKLIKFIRNYHPLLEKTKNSDINRIRKRLKEIEPEICHNTTEWRRRAIEQLMLNANVNLKQAINGSFEAINNFIKWRSYIDVPKETHYVLSSLSEKWPLVSITNGNAQPELFGLNHYFQFMLQAGKHGRSKPFKDMYKLAAERLFLAPKNILHIGDDLVTDVTGAIRFGMQSCWINAKKHNNLMKFPYSCLLPHLEISRLTSLILLK